MPSRAAIAKVRLPHGGTVCKCPGGKHPVIVRPAKPSKVPAPKGIKLKDPGRQSPGQKKLKAQKGKGKGNASPCDCKYFPPPGGNRLPGGGCPPGGC